MTNHTTSEIMGRPHLERAIVALELAEKALERFAEAHADHDCPVCLDAQAVEIAIGWFCAALRDQLVPFGRRELRQQMKAAIKTRGKRQARVEAPVPEGVAPHPAAERAAVALFDYLDAADEALGAHDNQGEGPDCECETCHDLRGQFYAVQTFRALLAGSVGLTPAIALRERLYEATTAARRASALPVPVIVEGGQSHG